MVTFSLIKVCNNCDHDNKEDANSCRFCGQLFLGKQNIARIYKAYGEILPQKKQKRAKTAFEMAEEIEKFGLKK